MTASTTLPRSTCVSDSCATHTHARVPSQLSTCESPKSKAAGNPSNGRGARECFQHTIHVPYGRVHMHTTSARGLCGPVHAALRGQADQGAHGGGPQLLARSLLPAHERGHLLHSPHACHSAGGVGGGGVRIASARLSVAQTASRCSSQSCHVMYALDRPRDDLPSTTRGQVSGLEADSGIGVVLTTLSTCTRGR